MNGIDELDQRIINELQGGFPICEQPFKAAAADLDIDEAELKTRIDRLVEDGVLSRFGPMYNSEKMGGAVTLCAIPVPADHYDDVAELLNARREVAHNYRRQHDLNMWFVLACEDPGEIGTVLDEIRTETGLNVYEFPKEEEFYIGLKVPA